MIPVVTGGLGYGDLVSGGLSPGGAAPLVAFVDPAAVTMVPTGTTADVDPAAVTVIDTPAAVAGIDPTQVTVIR